MAKKRTPGKPNPKGARKSRALALAAGKRQLGVIIGAEANAALSRAVAGGMTTQRAVELALVSTFAK